MRGQGKTEGYTVRDVPLTRQRLPWVASPDDRERLATIGRSIPATDTSRIDTPRGLANLQPGKVMVAGEAWAQNIGVAKVQVRVDGGGWQPTEIGPDGGIDYWRQWTYAWQATSGQHTLECRVIDDKGSNQAEVRAAPFPDGSSGLHSVVVTVG